MTDAIGAAETTQCGLAASRRTGAIDRQSCGKTNPQRDAGGQPLAGPGEPDTGSGNALAPIRGGGVTPWFIRARPARPPPRLVAPGGRERPPGGPKPPPPPPARATPN